MPANEDLVDRLLRHRLALLRYETGVVEEVLTAYDAALSDVVEALKKAEKAAQEGRPLSSVTTRLLRERGRRINATIKSLTASLDESFSVSLEAVVRFEAIGLEDAVVDLTNAGLSWASPSSLDVLATLDPEGVKPWTRLAARHGAEVSKKTRAGISRILAGTATPAKIVREAGQLLGVIEGKRGRLTGLVRTEVQRAANTAALATYSLNLDVIGGVVYLATFDSRTCLRCAPFHGKAYDYNKRGRLPSDAPDVPQHTRCRCTYAPRSRRWDELGLTKQRDFFDGASIAGPTFDQYLRKNKKEAAEILGPTRYEAWLKGLPLATFSDARGVLTLSQLKERYPKRFAA